MLKILGIWGAEIPSRVYSKTFLELMRDFCCNICDIALNLDQEETPAFAELLYSYGDRLLHLRVDQFSVDIRRQLVAACSKMRCKGDVEFTRDIGVLGAAVRYLRMCDEVGGLTAEQLAADTHACSDIEEPEVDVPDGPAAEETMRFLQFHKPLIGLIRLIIDDEGFGDAALGYVAMRTGGLRTFEYHGNLKETSVLDAIVTRAPLIETVVLGLPAETDDERLTDGVRSFARCPNLGNLKIQIDAERPVYVDEIAILVRQLRLRQGCKLENVLVEHYEYVLCIDYCSYKCCRETPLSGCC